MQVNKAVSTFFVRIFGVLASFLLVYLTNREYGLTYVGEIAYFGSILVIVSTVCKVGMEHWFVSKVSNNETSGIINIIALVTISVLVITLFILVIDVVLKDKLNYELYISIIILVYGSFVSYYYRGKSRFLLSTSIDPINLGVIFRLITLFFVLYVFEVELVVEKLYMYSLISYLIIIIIIMFVDFKDKHINIPCWEFNLISTLKVGVPVLISTLIIVMLNNVDKLILMNKLGANDTGLYDLAYKISSILLILFTTISTILSPKIANAIKNHSEELLNIYLRKTSVVMFFFGLAFLSLFNILDETIFGILDVSHSESLYVVNVLILSQVVNLAFGPVSIIMIMSGQQVKQMQVMILVLIISIPGMIFLVDEAGLTGAAYSFLISMFIQKSCLYYYVNKNTRFRYLEFKSEVK